jgi:cobalamin synthase
VSKDAAPTTGDGRDGNHGASNAPTALAAQLATALAYLTAVPLRPRAPLGESAAFFPAIGLALGALAVAIDGVLDDLPRIMLRNLMLVLALVVATRRRHVLAAARLAGGARRAVGAAAVVSVVGFKLAALSQVAPELRDTALLYAPMLGRWAMIVLAFGSLRARAGESALGRGMTFREFGLGSVFALLVTLATVAARGLVAILVLAVVTVAARIAAHRRWGGVSDDVAAAGSELGEAVALVILGFGIGPAPRSAVV